MWIQLVVVQKDDEDSVNSYYMYNPMWKTVMGMSTGEAIVDEVNIKSSTHFRASYLTGLNL